MKKLTLVLIAFLFFFNINAQTNKKTNLVFTKQEVKDDYKIVNFVLDKPATEVEFKEIYLSYKDDKNIIEITLENGTSCKAKVLLDVTPEYIQKYLLKRGFDFAYEVVVEQPPVNIKQEKGFPVHYPEKVKADGKVVDDASYQKALEFWKKRYPKEWEEYKNNTQK